MAKSTTRGRGASASQTRRRRTIAGIDHVIVGVRDLKQSAIAWRRLGFRLTPRGRHVGWGTANYCIMFLDSYVELLGILDPKQFTNNLDQFLKSREGLLSVAFGTPDAAAAAKALRRSGMAIEPPKDLSRRLETGEGDVTPRFRLIMLPGETTPGLSAFVCEHLTPELMRWPAWLTHANGAVSLKDVIAVVDDPAALAPAYERLFGGGAVSAAKDALHVKFARSRLTFLTQQAFTARHPGAGLPAMKPPFLAGLTIGVARLADTTQYFDDFGIPVTTGPSGTLRLDPAVTNGVIVTFEAA